MASYEVPPALLERVTLKLVQEMRNKQKLETGEAAALSLATQATSMSSEAEQGCHARISQYRSMYNEKLEDK